MNAVEQAKIIYPMLVKAAGERTKLTYGDVRKALRYGDNVSGQSFRYGLDIIVFYCLEGDFPQLTTLIVNKGSGEPSDTYAYDEDINYDEQQSASFKHKWEKLFDYKGIWDRRSVLREKYNF